MDRIRKGRRSDREFLDEEIQVVDTELASLKRQLTLDTQLRSRRPTPTPLPERIAEVLTDDAPADPSDRLRRWAIVQELVSQVIVHDTDDGLSVELYGPLVPESEDPGRWDPVDACASAGEGEPPRPSVPEPFRTRTSPERLVPAYRWRCRPCGEFAAGELTRESFVDAIRAAAVRYPSGSLFAARGEGHARWRAIAQERHLPLNDENITAAAASWGTTPGAIIRETLGREALTCGRVRKVQTREEAVWVIAQALSDGFSFESGWTVRIQEFGRHAPYPFTFKRISSWASRFNGGDVGGLIADARRTVASDG